MRRGTRRALIAAGLVAGGAIVAVLWIVPAVVASRLEEGLRDAGFPGAVVEGVRLGRLGITIDRIDLDEDGATRLTGVTARGAWGELAQGHVEAIAVGDATVAVTLARDRTATVAGHSFAGSGDGGPWPAIALPFDRAAVAAAHLTVDTPFGEATVELQDATVETTAETATLRAAIDARHAWGDMLGEVTGTLDAEGAAVRLDLASAELRHPAAAARASGWATAEMKPGVPVWLTGAMQVPTVTMGGVTFTAGELSFSGDAAAMSLIARAEGPGGARLNVDGTAAWAGTGGPGADVVATVDVPDVRAAGLPAEGAVDLRLALKAKTAGDQGWQAVGEFGLGITGAAMAGLVSEGSARLAGTVALSPGSLVLEGQQPWVIAGRIEPGLVPGLPEALLAEPLTLTLAPAGGQPVRLTASTGPDGARVGMDGGFGVTAGELAVASGTIAGLELALTGGSQVARLSVARLEAAAASQPMSGLDVGVARLIASLDGVPDAWTATVEADLDVATLAPIAGVEGHGSVHYVGTVAQAEGVLEAVPSACAAITFDALRLPGMSLTAPFTACLAAAEARPLVRLNASGVLALAGVSESAPFAAELDGEDGPTGVTGTWPAMTIDALWAPGGTPPAGSVVFTGGAGALDGLPLAVEAVEGRIDTEADGAAKLAMTARARHEAPLPFVAPLRLEAALARAPEGTVSGSASANDATGTISADAVGRYDPALEVGYADLTLYPITLVPGGRAIGDLFPALGAVVEEATGTVVFDGRATWTPAGAASRGELMLKDVAVTAEAGTVQAVNGVVAFDSLLPPVIPRGQTIAIGLADVGVPLTDGVIAIGLAKDGTVNVDKAEWHWADGTVRTQPFASKAEGPWSIVLEADGLDLGKLLELADVGGLSGEGTLKGRLPLRLEGATIAIENGELAATGPGTLAYAPAAGTDPLGEAAGGTEVLLDALRNFRYESLVMSIDGVSGGESTVLLRVQGANPDFYGGYPVALNLNLSGALDTILRRGLAGYRVPEAVARELEEFGGGSAP